MVDEKEVTISKIKEQIKSNQIKSNTQPKHVLTNFLVVAYNNINKKNGSYVYVLGLCRFVFCSLNIQGCSWFYTFSANKL